MPFRKIRSKISMQKLTVQEEEAMQIVWKIGKGFIKDFLELYPEPKPPFDIYLITNNIKSV